jgi:hypothetical protein
MEYEDADIVKPLDRLFKDQIREFESGSYRFSGKELKKMMRELGDFEIGCRTGRRRNRDTKISSILDRLKMPPGP